MNPYKGLLEFCRPEFFKQIGIGRGKYEIDKKTGEMTFVPGSGKWYVSHLDKSFYEGQMYNSEVFVSLQSISEEYYYYLKSRGASGKDDFYSEPVQILSNIKGGIGFMGAYSTSNVFRFMIE